MSPRILQLGACPYPAPFGSQVLLGGTAAALAEAGIATWLLTYDDGAAPDGVARVPGPSAPRGPLRVSGPHPAKPWLDARLVATFTRAVREHRIDVVHAHNTEAALVAAVAPLGRRVARLYDMHTAMVDELPTFGGGRAAATVGAVVDRVAARTATGCVALSHDGADRLRAWGARRVWTVPPGVTPSEVRGGDRVASRSAWGLGEAPTVLYAGNLDPYQDTPVLWRAVAQAPEVRLLVATGVDPDVVRWATAAEGLDPERVVVVPGDLATLRDALAAADMAAIPRARCAGFPMKLLNTLAAGVPTIVVDGAVDPRPGTVPVPPGDPTAMAAALRHLARHPARRAALAASGIAGIEQEGRWVTRARRLAAIYRDLVTDVTGG